MKDIDQYISKNTLLTIFVTLFFVSFFVLVLVQWNKSTESFSDNNETFATKKNISKNIDQFGEKIVSKESLLKDPNVTNAAKEVFAALEKFSQVKNDAIKK